MQKLHGKPWSSKELSEQEVNACFQKVRHGIEVESWPQFLRKVGFSEYDVQKQIQSDDFKKLRDLWYRKIGCFTYCHANVLEFVKDEVYDMKRNDEVDKILSSAKSRAFFKNRSRAWLMYGVVQNYHDIDYWNTEIVRAKLGVPEKEFRHFRANFLNNVEEQKFRALLFWVKQKKLRTIRAIVNQLRQLGVAVPDAGCRLAQEVPFDELSDMEVDDDCAAEDRRLRLELCSTIRNKSAKRIKPVPCQIAKYEHEEAEDESPPDQMSNIGYLQFFKAEELFIEARRNSREVADEAYSSEESKAKFIEMRGNVVGVVGSGGVGKTTLAEELLEFFRNNADSPYIFYVPIKYLNFETATTVLEFLVTPSLPEWEHSPDVDKALLKKISRSDQVYIFLDGLDEVTLKNFSRIAHKMNLHGCAKPDVILKNLLSGSLLSKSKKLLTSRPGAFQDLHREYRPLFTVKVLGLEENSQKMLCRQICSSEEEHIKVQERLKANPQVVPLCYIPMYCEMIVRFLRRNVDRQMAVVSSTNVFGTAFDECVRSDHMRDTISWRDITDLALWGMETDKYVFDVSDVLERNISEDDQKILEPFLNVDTKNGTSLGKRVLPGDKRYSFSHLLYQEYFAALHLMFLASLDRFSKLWSQFLTDRWDSVVTFMFGLINSSNRNKIAGYFLGYSKENFARKREKLLELIPSRRTRPFTMCNWALESTDPSVSRMVTATLPPKIYLHGNIFPIDVVGVSYVLRSDKTTSRNIRVGVDVAATFHGNSLPMLLDAIDASTHQITKLRVSRTKIGPSEARRIAKQIANFEALRLWDCNLTSCEVGILTQAVSLREKPLQALRLCGNNMCPESVTCLSQCIDNVKQLWLERCGLTGAAVEMLVEKISLRKQPIDWLNMSKNNMADSGVIALSTCLDKFKHLELAENNITQKGLEHLAYALEQGTSLDRLDLSDNGIGDQGVRVVARCCARVRVLFLKGNRISSHGAAMIAEALAETGMVERLDLNDNCIDDVGANALIKCSPKLAVLHLRKNNVSPRAVKEIEEHLARSNWACKVDLVGQRTGCKHADASIAMK